MINPHSRIKQNLDAVESKQTWQPVCLPNRRERDGDNLLRFYAYMITPGFSLAFHAVTLARSLSSVSAYRKAALQAAQIDPRIHLEVRRRLASIEAEHGLQMAQCRGRAQLPFWSRLAICEFRKRGMSRIEIAAAFRCSLGTIANVLQGLGQSFDVISGERRLTHAQRSPPGQW